MTMEPSPLAGCLARPALVRGLLVAANAHVVSVAHLLLADGAALRVLGPWDGRGDRLSLGSFPLDELLLHLGPVPHHRLLQIRDPLQLLLGGLFLHKRPNPEVERSQVQPHAGLGDFDSKLGLIVKGDVQEKTTTVLAPGVFNFHFRLVSASRPIPLNELRHSLHPIASRGSRRVLIPRGAVLRPVGQGPRVPGVGNRGHIRQRRDG
mmetsp:Transcript_434/g.860  ORF Transcript_434/g.860 Transcript_434/m.860 type:complete len:207 (-) Transcript_434:536-1156(-)